MFISVLFLHESKFALVDGKRKRRKKLIRELIYIYTYKYINDIINIIIPNINVM